MNVLSLFDGISCGQLALGYSDAQRYKMIGNGWTVDVVVHLLKGLHESRT